MVAVLRRRVSLRIIKLHWYLHTFGDCKKGILSFFYKGKKNSSCFFCLKKEWGFFAKIEM
jgi:hypothetical protein